MKLENIVAVSGLPGLYTMVANRNNGLIVEDMANGKRHFASARRHQFTPLKSIAIYTDDGDSTELKNVFRNMLDQFGDNPPVDPNSSAENLHEYFTDVLPNFDKDRVNTGDIKKVIKWFTFLKEVGQLQTGDEEDATEEE